MFRKICLLFVLLFSVASLTFLPAQTAKSDSELQAMKSDVQRMRVILNQMRTNLAFVDNTQSPVKHQFELETDMWQVALDQMDRRIAAMENGHQSK
ncbi:MAG TPA: hypothetical protein VLK33_03705 [Terriglobales bacterium]|nr:hypothetical protein [Terriglobales bacterium]